MTENMKMFLEIASKNEELREKLNKMDKEALIAAAKELGVELTEADFTQPTGEVSDDELEAVAGGGECVCVGGGGGTDGLYDRTCACVLYGFGKYTQTTKYETNHQRCDCLAGGYGHSEEI